MEMGREDILSTFSGSTWSHTMNKIADTSTESACNQKVDIDEWKGRGIFS